ncbi:sigma-70 family RNA polymerase sigma factor [Provencibacterium massiliense]|uniref:sigma-70 family RNA polymerase sigma factor n=1 Tax=Provencibacterium massiliense TaxID=1841868 RepID=UPI0009A718D1|nr:sigma-70 family RNA polymerase sigma factor [Provencibacterium massiliense]RGB69618.1 sigma-70 family RNA polymerase sigma factor [Harryflintia acetispora]
MEQLKSASVILTNEELVELYRAGDLSTLEALWLQNYGLIRQTVRGLCKNEPDAFEDEMQEAYFALVDAVDKYDRNGGKKLTTYICNAIKWRKYRRYQTQRKHHPENTVSLNAPVSGFEDEDITLETSIPDPVAEFEEASTSQMSDPTVQAELNTIMQEIIENLPGKCRIVMDKRLKGCSQTSIARQTGMSSSQVQQLETKGHRVFRKKENYDKLKPYLDYYGIAYKHTGFRFWKETGYSSVEWAVEMMEKHNLKRAEG